MKPTDDMIENGAAALYAYKTGRANRLLFNTAAPAERDGYRNQARAVLEAALRDFDKQRSEGNG